jgi:hypothetical protein
MESLYGVKAEILPLGPNLYAFLGNNGVNKSDYLGLHEGYPKPIGTDACNGNWVFENEDGSRFAIDSKTKRRVALCQEDTATPETPQRCPMKEPKGNAGWKEQSGALGGLSESVFHDGYNCYREAVAKNSAQCCYDCSGSLRDGDVDTNNPDFGLWDHLKDVLDHIF